MNNYEQLMQEASQLCPKSIGIETFRSGLADAATNTRMSATWNGRAIFGGRNQPSFEFVYVNP